MKYKIGDKVIPISKSIGCSFDESTFVTYNLKYLIVNKIDKDKTIWCYFPNNEDSYEEKYLEKDLTPYRDSKKIIKELLK